MLKWIRSTVFWLHLVLGVAAAAIVLVMSVTGVLLTYQRQIQTWADMRSLDGAPPQSGMQPLPVASLVATVQETKDPGTPTAVRWRSRNDAPVEVVFGREGSVYVNAYTGAVLGTGADGVRAFFRSMTDWHRWLARQGDARERGKAITGAANLAFLFIVLSGLWLWWPRNRSAAALRNILWFRRGLRPKARDFNWHNVAGFWSLVPLFIVVLSGVVISYQWAGDLVYRAVGEAPPARPGSGGPTAARAGNTQTPGQAGAGRREGGRDAGRAQLSLAEVDDAVLTAMHHTPEWRIITMQLAAAEGGAISFSVDRGDGGQPHKRSTVVLSTAGAVLKEETFADASTGRQMRSILRFAHTGEVLGVVGQTIAGIVSLAAVLLVWTGLIPAGR
jgi:uncharacterized iron-regulated membrane protein